VIKDLRKRRNALEKEVNLYTESDWGESLEPDKIDAQIELLDEIIPELEGIC
jgi:hypothetical protein